MGLLFFALGLTILFWLFFRIIRLFSSHKSAEKTTHYERQSIRKIYLQPVSLFAKKIHIKWDQQSILSSGRYNHYVNGYLLPYLTIGEKMFTVIHYPDIISVDCVVDLGAIYPYRFYLKDGDIVDFIKEREVLKELKPVKVMSYREKLSNSKGLCVILILALTVIYGFRMLYMLDHQDYYFYPEYYCWLSLLSVDALIIFRPWLLFVGTKSVYSYRDFYEKSHLVSSKFEMPQNVDETLLKYMTGDRGKERLFFIDVHGLVSNDSYLDSRNIMFDLAMMFAIGSTVITLFSLMLFLFVPWLAVVQIVLYVFAWVLVIKF